MSPQLGLIWGIGYCCLLPTSFSARKLPALLFGSWWILGGVCVWESELYILLDNSTFWQELEQVFRKDTVGPSHGEWLKSLGCMDLLISFLFTPISKFRHWIKKALFLTKALSNHFLFLPPPLLIHSREEPRMSSPLSKCWACCAHQMIRKLKSYLSGQWSMCFFMKHKIYMTINKKINQEEFKGLLSQSALQEFLLYIS